MQNNDSFELLNRSIGKYAKNSKIMKKEMTYALILHMCLLYLQ
jgi:hypothetical protein